MRSQSARRFTALYVSAVISLLLITQPACYQGTPGNNHAREQLAQHFGELPVQNLPSAPARRKHVEVYIDGSGSMRGFIRGRASDGEAPLLGQTVYSSTLRDLRALLTSREDRVEFYKFGAAAESLAMPVNEPLQAVNQTSFYNQGDTLLGQLIKHLASREAENLPDTFILVTDGVQSTPTGSDFTEVVGAVRELGKRGFQFQVLAFRSDFNGEAFSELLSERGQDDRIGNYQGERAFYWYVFSSVPDTGKELSDFLRDEHQVANEYLNLSASPFIGSQVQIERSSDAPRSFVRESNSAEPDLISLRWNGQKDNTQLIGKVTVTVQLRIHKDFQNLSMRHQFRLKVESLNLKTGNEVKSEISLAAASIVESKPESLSLEFQFAIPRLEQPGQTAHRVSVLPKDAAFDLPSWVSENSTEDDTLISNYSKTLFIKDFIANLFLKDANTQRLTVVYFLIEEGDK